MPVAIVVVSDVPLAFEACLFMCCLLVAFTQTSIMSLLAIAVDRYLRVRFIIRRSSQHTRVIVPHLNYFFTMV
ncbi:UNVERIFIED_CONTAM: hypothetical protein K2H54_060155 [Gekko kuhli]